MGLKATIAGAVAAGFAALGDLREDVTYRSLTAGTYNPTTGAVTRTETSTAISGVFMEYSKREIDGQQIQPHDRKFICQQAAFAGTPQLTDRLIRSDASNWEIIWVKEDPAHATWELQVRARNG